MIRTTIRRHIERINKQQIGVVLFFMALWAIAHTFEYILHTGLSGR